MDNLSKLGL